MSRLLFAAARGARIEYRSGADWYPALSLPSWEGDPQYRIHPDDEHLQYGSISTALRLRAKEPPKITLFGFSPVERQYLNVYKYSDEMYMYADEMHKGLFLLILAEALADEGL